MTKKLQLDVWSDVYCPWCYIGKRRLERALQEFEHRDLVTITWRSFQLDPSAPRVFEGDINDMLARKYGMTRAQAEGSHARLTALAKQDGLDYRFDLAKPGNTLDAHRLIHFAAKHGKADALQERLMHAYFTEGVAISDTSALAQLAADVGLDVEQARDVLDSDAFADDARGDQLVAQRAGISGVPAFVFNQKYAVVGAQSSEILLKMLRRAYDEQSDEGATNTDA